MIKVIVFSDIKIYRDGIGSALAGTGQIDVIGAESRFDDAAIDKIRLESPDVILLDMTMQDSCSLAHEVKRLFAQAKIVALAVPENETNIVRCAEAGIAGYVAREASMDELIATVIGARRGEFCCPPRIAAHVFNKFHDIACSELNQSAPPASRDPRELITALTRREQQIFSLMANGLSNKHISRDLNIEVSTVKNHVHNILVKLDVKSRAGAVSLVYGKLSPLLGSNSYG